MWMWQCVERGIYLGSEADNDRNKYCEAKKDTNRIVSMAIGQAAQQAVGNVNSCCDGYGLFRIAKQIAWEKLDDIQVNCLKDERKVVQVYVSD